MKTFYIIFSMIFFSLISTISMGQNQHEINKLDKEIELLLDSAAKHMVDFILTQKETEYALAMEKVSRAESMNQTLTTKAAEEKGVTGKIEKEIIEDREEEIETYKDASIKNTILNEKKESRKIKVKHKGESYYVSEKSKKVYDLFSSYLPRN